MLDVSIKENSYSETHVVFVTLNGALDSEKSIDFYDFINAEIIKGFRKFVVDCTNLDYISSSGISIMIRLQHKLKEKESVLAYFGLNKEISLVINFFGLKKEISIADNSDNAIRLIQPGQDAFTDADKIYSIIEESKSELDGSLFTDSTDSTQYEPIQVQFSEARTASLLEPEIAKKIKSNRLTLTDAHDTLTEEQEIVEEIAISSIEPVKSEPNKSEPLKTEPVKSETTKSEPILESITPKYSELKIKLPFITRTETNPSKSTIMDSITDFESDHTERYEVSSLSQVTDTNFTVLVVNCGNCGSKIRIRKQGKQQCPKCRYKFLLRQSGSISTIERLS